MGDDNDGAVFDLLAHLFKDADQVLEAPEVDARFRLVKHRKARMPCKQRRDLNPLQLSAGERGVDLAVDIVPRAQPYLREIVAGRRDGEILSGCQAQQVLDADALEADRLLEGEADTEFGPFGDIQLRDMAGQGRLAAAVGSGNNDEFSVVDGEIQIPKNLFLSAVLLDGKAQVFDLKHNFWFLTPVCLIISRSVPGFSASSTGGTWPHNCRFRRGRPGRPR